MNAVKWGVIFSVLTIFFGFALGAAMGGAEDTIRAYWQNAQQPVLQSIYQGDTIKAKTMLDRSWRMFIRAHLHAAALGSASLVLIYFLSRLNLSARIKQILSIFLGLGGLGYALSWLYLAFNAPVMGDLHAVKASIHPLAVVSIGMLFTGTLAVLGSYILVALGKISLEKPE